MPQTTNKGYEVQVTGSNSGTWGDVLNASVISYIDQNMGGLTTLSLASSPVVLSASQSRDCILRLTGVLLANVQITTACVGFFFVENVTTGSFSVTVTNGVAGAVAPQGNRVIMISDTTNGVRVAATDTFPTGTKCLFFQTTAPTGWTKDTSLDNGAIRLVSGTVGADAGTADFTTVFAARTILQANIPDYNLNLSGVTATASTTATVNVYQPGPGGVGVNTAASPSSATVTVTIGGTLPSGGSGTAMDFAVKYASAIRATKA